MTDRPPFSLESDSSSISSNSSTLTANSNDSIISTSSTATLKPPQQQPLQSQPPTTTTKAQSPDPTLLKTQPRSTTTSTTQPNPKPKAPKPQPFKFPTSHSFPPIYTLQPNPTTREAQFRKWSRKIQAYCSYKTIFSLAIPDCLEWDLFRNGQIRRRLREHDLRVIVNWMCSGVGGRRAEWRTNDPLAISPSPAMNMTTMTMGAGTAGGGGGGGDWKGGGGGVGGAGGVGGSNGLEGRSFWVFWRRPEEWADAIYTWVEETGQKGSILTLWEMLEGEATEGQRWHGMDGELFDRALKVLVKRGKCQVFGEEDSRGVKFF